MFTARHYLTRGPTGVAHSIPIVNREVPSAEVALPPEDFITRNAPHEACPLCTADRCWQALRLLPGCGPLMVHGVQLV